MPDGKTVFRRTRTQNGRGRRTQRRADGVFGEHADQQAGGNQQQAGEPHAARRLVRTLGQIAGFRTEENLMHETQRIGDAEHPGQRCCQRHRRVLPAGPIKENGFRKEHFLGEKAVEQGHPGHRCRRDHRQCRGDRHGMPETGKPPQIAGAGFMVDDPRRHKQRGLEGGVIEDVEDGGNQRKFAVHAQKQGDEAQMEDRRIGQKALHVVLEHRQITGHEQRSEARATDDPEPSFAPGQHRPKARQQKHPGLDHRRRMQKSGNRRRRGHRVRQPEMEGKLRAFGECAEGDQRQCRRIPGMRLQRGSGGQHRTELIAARHMTEQQHPAEQRKPPGAGHDQRHARPAPRLLAMVPVGNQHERGNTGQLPEQHDLDQVAGKHHAKHGRHESQQKGEKARHRVGRRHVVACIEHHQRADAADQQGKEPGEGVHAQREIEAQRR